MLYHANFGDPLLDAAKVVAPINELVLVTIMPPAESTHGIVIRQPNRV